MARTPDGLSARDKIVPIRGTASWVALLDRLRGEMSRSAYIRSLVERDRAERARKQADRP